MRGFIMAQPSNPFDQQRPIEGIKKVIAVSSGKGGVGKSTVAANLAVALSRLGARVGLLDADIYGPSIPRLFGTLHQKVEIGEDKRLQPLERYKIKLMSLGYLVDEDLAVVWRGPMLFKAMEQFLREVAWGELDFLLVDLPPGTGDIQLSLAQKIPIAGAIAVSTPQDVALMDVKKAIDMWNRVGVKLFGVVENMSYFIPPGSSEKIQLFPKGSLDSYLKERGIRKLGEIPFHPSVGLSSEAGIPIVESDPSSDESKAFIAVARLLQDLTHDLT
jgi:ATP-binding protein involved in chromosome partitioning